MHHYDEHVNQNTTRKQRRRHRLWMNVGGKCPYCGQKMWVRGFHAEGKPAREATLEHITPKSQGGSNDISNLTCSCKGCNRSRGSIAHEDFKLIRGFQQWQWLTNQAKKNNHNLTFWMVVRGKRRQLEQKGRRHYQEVVDLAKSFIPTKINMRAAAIRMIGG